MELTDYTKLHKVKIILFIFSPFIYHGRVNTNYCKIIIIIILKDVTFLTSCTVNGKVIREKSFLHYIIWFVTFFL